MANDYYLRIVRFTQSSSANGKETTVEPEKIDYGHFLHIYVSGEIPAGTDVRISRTQLPEGGTYTYPDPAKKVGNRFKYTVTHYTLKRRTKYRLRAFDRPRKKPPSKPNCVASHDIKTL